MNTKTKQISFKIENLISLIKSNDLSFLQPILERLEMLKEKIDKNELIIPLLGEFSSGKSSLINSLIGKNLLPVDITPTTFIVHEIRFSSEKDLIEIEYEKDKNEKYEDLSVLHAIDYKTAKLIRVYLKDKVIPHNIILVDIPGISSIISEHEDVVSSYLPKADCIFLINDINQATLTKSTLSFLEFTKSLDKEIFLILSKSDTKSKNEIEDIKDYFRKNFTFFSDIIITSAVKNQIQEFLSLIDKVSQQAADMNLNYGIKSFRELCSTAKLTVSQHLEDTKLDLREIEAKIKDTENLINSLEIDFENKLKKLKNGLETAKNNAIHRFQKYLESKTNYLTDIFFSNSENFQIELENTIHSAIEQAARLFEKEVKIYIEDFKGEIEIIGEGIKIPTTVQGILIGISETIKLVLLNLILPGGPIAAIIGRIVLLILEKIPKVGKLAGSISQIINLVVLEIGKMVAKSYIAGKIHGGFIKSFESFDYEINTIKDLLFREIKNILHGEFTKSLKMYKEGINQLYTEKQNTEKDFNEYKTKIKNLILKIEEICNYS